MVAPAPLSPVGSELRPAAEAVPFDETVAAQRPLAIRSVSLPTPSDPPHEPNGRSFSTSAASPESDHRPATARSVRNTQRNGGLTPPTPSGEDFGTPRSEDDQSVAPSLHSVPSIVIHDSSRPSSRPGSRPGSRWSERKWGGLRKRSAELERKMSMEELPPVPQIEPEFSGISLDIPTASLGGLGQGMKFSTRGSLIRDRSKRPYPALPKEKQLEGVSEKGPASISEEPSVQSVTETGIAPEAPPSTPSVQDESNDENLHAVQSEKKDATNGAPTAVPRARPQSSLRPRQTSLQSRAISADEDMLSRRVRLMYEKGDDNVTDAEVAKAIASENGVLWEEPTTPDIETASTPPPEMILTDHKGRASEEVERIRMKRETRELAGGIEYWQDVGAGQVDRYGFIHAPADEPHPIQRVTTSLLLASEAPRRKRSIRPPTARASTRSFSARSPTRDFSQSSATGRPNSSRSTHSMPVRRSTSRLRSATNHLPHNRDRKTKDEAGDMLTLPGDVIGEGQDTAAARAMRRKEWEREDKWTKMAKPVQKTRDGGGMKFEFDTHSSKLIERTWKGIPDRWRSTAWYSFLESSARRHENSPSEDTLIAAFHDYQYISSPDDVQIDIDVPRTITSHIMFRRRYRGGQRLLFRVLHAMSLYFPDTGYVQGMAALAATLLAYYDEEHAFVMLARLWQLRGLEELYKSGFAGLMEALDDFEREWLAGGEVASKLNEVGIPPTAYGTRWYLTLFNYSIPFPAQLRVWDVFMLLGDAEDLTASARPNTSSGKAKGDVPAPRSSTFGQGLDVLHATSAALIDGMRDIILESDFENGMKVLTSWVPIKDIEIFMRVAKTEYKVHRRKKAT
ncbi:Putative Rab6 GTPase activator GAPCenA [Penicillium brasilianum]|uniref:Putative Rab6 GTPase activator GAPCenA n=1 Tax=Penicillium brasilianum TaxID=104259 RepID=A0A0F7THP9_PENBI|nr:Putative Rab6 GTPase activator GAPCenA [Penicillium brasilianum]